MPLPLPQNHHPQHTTVPVSWQQLFTMKVAELCLFVPPPVVVIGFSLSSIISKYPCPKGCTKKDSTRSDNPGQQRDGCHNCHNCHNNKNACFWTSVGERNQWHVCTCVLKCMSVEETGHSKHCVSMHMCTPQAGKHFPQGHNFGLHSKCAQQAMCPMHNVHPTGWQALPSGSQLWFAQQVCTASNVHNVHPHWLASTSLRVTTLVCTASVHSKQCVPMHNVHPHRLLSTSLRVTILVCTASVHSKQCVPCTMCTPLVGKHFPQGHNLGLHSKCAQQAMCPMHNVHPTGWQALPSGSQPWFAQQVCTASNVFHAQCAMCWHPYTSMPHIHVLSVVLSTGLFPKSCPSHNVF